MKSECKYEEAERSFACRAVCRPCNYAWSLLFRVSFSFRPFIHNTRDVLFYCPSVVFYIFRFWRTSQCKSHQSYCFFGRIRIMQSRPTAQSKVSIFYDVIIPPQT